MLRRRATGGLFGSVVGVVLELKVEDVEVVLELNVEDVEVVLEVGIIWVCSSSVTFEVETTWVCTSVATEERYSSIKAYSMYS